MNKQKVSTAAGIALSFAIAIGGWALTSKLIDIKSDALLSAKGITYIDVPMQTTEEDSKSGDGAANSAGDSFGSSAGNGAANSDANSAGDGTANSGGDGVGNGASNGDANGAGDGASNGTGDGASNGAGNSIEQERRSLNEQEIYRVLLNWEATGSERAHEPSETQISMEQAIEASKSGLAYFAGQGAIPADALEQEFEKIYAHLCHNQIHGQTPHFLDPIFSYWAVALTGERIDASLVINAVTGQIWKANIIISTTSAVVERLDATKMLDAFVSYFEMESGSKTGIAIDRYETIAYTDIAGSMIQATVSIRTEDIGNTSTVNTSTIMEINMYLSALLDDGGELNGWSR